MEDLYPVEFISCWPFVDSQKSHSRQIKLAELCTKISVAWHLLEMFHFNRPQADIVVMVIKTQMSRYFIYYNVIGVEVWEVGVYNIYQNYQYFNAPSRGPQTCEEFSNKQNIITNIWAYQGWCKQLLVFMSLMLVPRIICCSGGFGSPRIRPCPPCTINVSKQSGKTGKFI